MVGLGRGFSGLKKAIRERLIEDFDKDLKDVKGQDFCQQNDYLLNKLMNKRKKEQNPNCWHGVSVIGMAPSCVPSNLC